MAAADPLPGGGRISGRFPGSPALTRGGRSASVLDDTTSVDQFAAGSSGEPGKPDP